MCGREKQPSHPIATSMKLRRDRRRFIGKNEANPRIIDKERKKKRRETQRQSKKKKKIHTFSK